MLSSETPRTGDPRARAAQTKRDRTRRALLDAADATFGSRGWARTRVEDIAAAAGVSAATAYNHFPSKHALIGHVYRPLVLPLVVQAEHDVHDGRSVTDALIDQVKALVRTASRHRVLTAAFHAGVQDYTSRASASPRDDDDLDPRNLVPLPEALRILIEHGQRSGELRSYPPAADISSMIVDLMLARGATNPEEPAATTAELLLTLLFGALRPDMLAANDDQRPFRRR
jgi:AcrR family transcriptional regulator